LKSQPTLSDIDLRDAFFDEVYNFASKDPNFMFLTADMGAFALKRLKADLPSQYINLGVAEQSLVSIAAGLALSGKKVFTYAIASFMTQRCYEQIKIDLCYMHLPVTIVGAGPGLTYSSEGPTHHAIEDVAILRTLPNIIIFNPSDSVSAAKAAKLAYESRNPFYVRLDRGKYPLLYSETEDFSTGMTLLKSGRDVLIVATGLMVHQALRVADELAKHSISTGVLDLYRIKPINESLLSSFVEQSAKLVILEEHLFVGGLGSAVIEILADKGKSVPIKRFAIPHKNYRGHGDREWMHKNYGLDFENICNTIIANE